MKVLILDTYYPRFWQGVYSKQPGLDAHPYSQQWRSLMDQYFGTSDFYSANLAELGHEAEEIVVNCWPLQAQWAQEHGGGLAAGLRRDDPTWQMRVVEAQVRWMRPDVLYLQDVTTFEAPFLESLRDCVRLIVGQTAYALDWAYPFGVYDLMLTSLPHYVDRFRSADVDAEYFRLGFEPKVLDHVPKRSPDAQVVFAGGLSAAHRTGGAVLEQVARSLPSDFWGYGKDGLPEGSAIRGRHRGEVWGLDMYRVLAGARVVLNRHADFAGQFANNMRLYEATGVGSCLVTDAKGNLGDMFGVGTEVVAYQDPKDCVEKIRYLLDHEAERAAIAAAGQARTLREHTYAQRMAQLVGILEAMNSSPQAGRVPANGLFETDPGGGAARGTALATVRVARWAERAARRMAAAVPLPGWAKDAGRRGLGVLRSAAGTEIGASSAYAVLDQDAPVDLGEFDGWTEATVAERQDAAYQKLLDDLHAGHPRRDLEAAAEAVRRTGIDNPLLLEVGCGSGYYSEILPTLLGRPLRYVGLDYSRAMVTRARRRYRRRSFVQGDATRLPFAGRTVDVVFNGAALMHIPDYRAAVSEGARIARGWCIFHTVTVRSVGPTTLLAKAAYGGRTLEVVFNEAELVELFRAAGLEVRETLEGIPYDLEPVIGELTVMRTYVCEVA